MSVRSVRRGIAWLPPMRRRERVGYALVRGAGAGAVTLIAWIILLYALGAERLNATALYTGAVIVALVFVAETAYVYRRTRGQRPHVKKAKSRASGTYPRG